MLNSLPFHKKKLRQKKIKRKTEEEEGEKFKYDFHKTKKAFSYFPQHIFEGISFFCFVLAIKLFYFAQNKLFI